MGIFRNTSSHAVAWLRNTPGGGCWRRRYHAHLTSFASLYLKWWPLYAIDFLSLRQHNYLRGRRLLWLLPPALRTLRAGSVMASQPFSGAVSAAALATSRPGQNWQVLSRALF